MTQGEIEGRREGFLDKLFDGEVPMLTDAPVGRSEYARRLLTGGFPESLTRTGAARARFFQATSARSSTAICAMPRAYMTRGRSGRCCDSSPLGRLRSPATRTLGRDAGIDGKTAKTHLDVLERLFLVRIRRPWHANLGKRQVKVAESVRRRHRAASGADRHRRTAVRNDDGLAGALFATFVATELERQASWSVTPLTFWHYREQEREVDIIAERPSGELVGIEVKASATVRERDFQGLKHMRDQLGSRLRAGIVIYTGQRTLAFGARFFAVPLEGPWR